ncbi:MAG: hypothetical protein OEL91_02720 [Burkholderiaceae bacterium]|nr:hypothetical protein [Burkholderiaceae bacterium]
MNYMEQDFESMVRHIGVALRDAEPDHHTALSRACLVVAQAYHWAERLDLSLPWYARAHQHATAEGDEAMLSALMHNMAWLRAAQARRLSVNGVTNRDEICQALAGAESTGHFDERVGTATLGSLVPILRAHMLVLHERYSEALELFSNYLTVALDEGLGRLQCVMLADIAWCRLNTGDNAGALKDAQDAQTHIADCVQADERAAAHGRLAQLYAALGNVGASQQHAAQASADWNSHARRQAYLVGLLSGTVSISTP